MFHFVPWAGHLSPVRPPNFQKSSRSVMMRLWKIRGGARSCSSFCRLHLPFPSPPFGRESVIKIPPSFWCWPRWGHGRWNEAAIRTRRLITSVYPAAFRTRGRPLRIPQQHGRTTAHTVVVGKLPHYLIDSKPNTGYRRRAGPSRQLPGYLLNMAPNVTWLSFPNAT